jgi:uncharacterized glyoxalase superfamily protein PhnB
MPLELEGLSPLLQVFDMPTSVNFYRQVLGFELVTNSPIVNGRDGDYFHWCMLRGHGCTVMLNTAYDEGDRPPAPDAARVAAHGDISLYFNCSNVDATFNHLVSHGAKVLEEPFVTQYGMTRFTIADPDGYNLSFHGPGK